MDCRMLQCHLCYRQIWKHNQTVHLQSPICFTSPTLLKFTINLETILLLHPAFKGGCLWCGKYHKKTIERLYETECLSLTYVTQILMLVYNIISQSQFKDVLPPKRLGFENPHWQKEFKLKKPWPQTLIAADVKDVVDNLFRIWVVHFNPRHRFHPLPHISIKDPLEWKYISPEQWDQVIPSSIQEEYATFTSQPFELSFECVLKVIKMFYQYPQNIRLLCVNGDYYVRDGRVWTLSTSEEATDRFAGIIVNCLMDPKVLTRERDVARGYYSVIKNAFIFGLLSVEFQNFSTHILTQEFYSMKQARQFEPCIKQAMLKLDHNKVEFIKQQQMDKQSWIMNKSKRIQEDFLVKVKKIPCVPRHRPRF